MGRLTTHVLDTHAGVPAGAVRIEVHSATGPVLELLGVHITQDNGRCEVPLLEGAQFRSGCYLLTFHIGEYFARRGLALPDPPFLEQALVRIGIADAAQHYHVPLLVTPWSYSVYRGG